MSILQHFAALATGQRPADDGLLGNCRFEWRGTEACGEEAILEIFRGAPFDSAQALLVETAAAAAWIGPNGALIADLYDGRIGRLWRIGEGHAPPPEPAVSVAFDPDLRQARGDISIDPADHPELAADMLGDVVAAGHALLMEGAPKPIHRARAFCVRAFSGTNGTAALFAVHCLTGGAVRSGGFGYAAVRIGGASVADHAPDIAWTPRL